MIYERIYKITIQNIHNLGWKEQSLKSAGVLMLGHGCGVSQHPQFYDRIKNIYQMLQRPYVGSYIGENGHQWIIVLAKSVETFFMVSISDMLTMKNWKTVGSMVDKAKY